MEGNAAAPADKGWLSGTVVSGYGGFYQVWPDAGGAVVNCRGRGRLKKSHQSILTGDAVWISLLRETGENGVGGMIEAIAPRRNRLARPHIANIDLTVIVLSWRLPEYDLLLLDRMLLMCRLAGVETALCFNKIDLMLPEERPALAEISAVYTAAGCPVLAVSAAQDELDGLCELLSGRRSVFAGPSGVGKSSLLNRLLPDENAEVGQVSDRLQRGKHTTRYTRLLPLDWDAHGGMLADTPGFFVLDAPDAVTEDMLPSLYPEYKRLFAGADGCRFDGCRHDREPGCAVRAAVEAGRLDEGRYQRYLRILHEIQTREVKYK